MQIAECARVVLEQLKQVGYESFLVGGCVRDTLLGRTPKDWDICTAATPEELLSCFSGFSVYLTGLKHGTVTVLSAGEPVEVTTFRSDGEYSDHRHPDGVRFGCTLAEDLSRRDFTMNAMAYSQENGLIDPFGGEKDLQSGLIRCVGDPDRRFSEDGLRILRALRFAARYGFRLEEDTAESIRRCRTLLHNISAERTFSELKGILCGQGAGEILRTFPEVFFEILPELAPMAGFDQENPHHRYDVFVHTTHAVDAVATEPILRLTMLLHDSGKPAVFTRDRQGVGHFYGHGDRSTEIADVILNRLKSDQLTRREVLELVRRHDTPLPGTKRGMRRLLAKLGQAQLRRLLCVHRADCMAQAERYLTENLAEVDRAEALLEELLTMESCISLANLQIDGDDLIAMGVPQGREIGAILAALLGAVLDGSLPNKRGALFAEAQKQIKNRK